MKNHTLGLILAICLLYFVDRTLAVTVSIEGGGTSFSKEVVEGTNPDLVCHYVLIKPNGIKRVRWYYAPQSQPQNNTILLDKNRVPTKHKGRVEPTGTQANLRLLNISRTQPGFYSCVVAAPEESPSEARAVYTVTVIVPPSPPVCRYSSVRVRIGRTARFSCNSDDGIPTPKYAWYKEDLRLPLNKSLDYSTVNMSYVYSETTGNMFFSRFSKYDEGNYTCLSYNRAGRELCSYTYVTAAPSHGTRPGLSYLSVFVLSIVYLLTNTT